MGKDGRAAALSLAFRSQPLFQPAGFKVFEANSLGTAAPQADTTRLWPLLLDSLVRRATMTKAIHAIPLPSAVVAAMEIFREDLPWDFVHIDPGHRRKKPVTRSLLITSTKLIRHARHRSNAYAKDVFRRWRGICSWSPSLL
jgi:hypothetical protein